MMFLLLLIPGRISENVFEYRGRKVEVLSSKANRIDLDKTQSELIFRI